MYSHYSHHQDLVDQERKKSKIRMTFAIRARSIKQPCGTPWIPRGIALVIFFFIYIVISFLNIYCAYQVETFVLFFACKVEQQCSRSHHHSKEVCYLFSLK